MGKYKNSAISSFMSMQNETTNEQLEKFQTSIIEPEERHSRRVHLLMKPTVYSKVKAFAERNNTSVNHVVESLIEKYL